MKLALWLCLLASTAFCQLRTDVIYTRFSPTLYSLRKPVPVLFEARVGAGIDSVTVCLPCSFGLTPVKINLNDQGTDGDRVAGAVRGIQPPLEGQLAGRDPDRLVLHVRRIALPTAAGYEALLEGASGWN